MRIATILLSLFLITGCGDSSDNDSSNPIPENPVEEQDSDLAEVLNKLIQNRFRSLYTFQSVIRTLGNLAPFAEAARDEVENTEKVKDLFDAFDLETPQSLWSLGNVPIFGNLEAACEAGVKNETESIEFFDKLLADDLPPVVDNVLQDLRDRAANKHLPAFQQCQ